MTEETTSQPPEFTVSLERLRDPEAAREEFARIVEAYSGLVYRIATKMLDDPQDAEDVLQETFLKAYRSLDQFEGRSSLSTWLYRIATNETLMLLRRKKNFVISFDDSFESEETKPEPVQIVDWCCLPEVELMSAETRAQLSAAVDAMPSTLKVVFVLRDLEGLSTAETGEVLDLSETAVKTRLSRARFFLRERLSEYFGERISERDGNSERDRLPDQEMAGEAHEPAPEGDY